MAGITLDVKMNARELGNDYFRKLLFTKAIASYQKAVTLDPDDYRPSLNISAAHYELGNYDKAIENIHRALSLIPATNDAVSKLIHLRPVH